MQHILSTATVFQRRLLALGGERIQPVEAKKTTTPYAGVQAPHESIPRNCRVSLGCGLGFAVHESECIPSFAGVAGL